ncbi:MAG: hypothetical protein KDA72_20690, partial [Planctomycetales bacterium]|nr:hypothetical protein [Planctomycetales bacterium]
LRMEYGGIVTHTGTVGRNDIAVLRAMVGDDGKTVAGEEPVLGHRLLAVRADATGRPGIAAGRHAQG